MSSSSPKASFDLPGSRMAARGKRIRDVCVLLQVVSADHRLAHTHGVLGVVKLPWALEASRVQRHRSIDGILSTHISPTVHAIGPALAQDRASTHLGPIRKNGTDQPVEHPSGCFPQFHVQQHSCSHQRYTQARHGGGLMEHSRTHAAATVNGFGPSSSILDSSSSSSAEASTHCMA